MCLVRCYFWCIFSWQGAHTDTFLFSHFFIHGCFFSWDSFPTTHCFTFIPCLFIYLFFLPVTCSPQPLCYWAAPVVQSDLLPGLTNHKVWERGELCHIFSAGISFQTADLPVTSLSLQLSATFTTAAIMQNNFISHLLTSPTSTNCLTQSASPNKNPSGLFTCSPCCLTQSCSWHPVVFNLVQVCVVP